MPLWTCEQCGAQFPESATPPPACPVCEDERQYVNWKGQTWLTREELAKGHKLVWRDDLGIVGLGAIGATMAQLCLDLGARVRGYDPFANADRIVHPNFARVDLDGAITGVDAVSLHAPLPEDGRPLLTAERIAAMKPATVLVNTARAGLVDAETLLEALDSGHVACYATDVFETEPPAHSSLLDHPKVVLTSHIGGFTDASVERSTVRAVANLLDALARDAH